jgi:Tfp pilus assembly protein PilO
MATKKKTSKMTVIKSSLVTMQIYNIMLVEVSHDLKWPWYEEFSPLFLLLLIYVLTILGIGFNAALKEIVEEEATKKVQEQTSAAPTYRVMRGRKIYEE